MAGDIAKKFYQYFVDNGFKDNFVYGPLHSTGIIEVEAPWAETSSMYPLQLNMTYQAERSSPARRSVSAGKRASS